MGRHVRQREDFEQGEQSFLLRFLKPAMTVLDLGAHQGFYTLTSKKVGPHGRVIAFEPSSRELHRLRWNLRISLCRNVRVKSCSLGSKKEVADLNVCAGQETGCNSLRPPDVAEPIIKVPVPVKTLDRYLEKATLQTVDYVKLDVLKGAKKHLVPHLRPLIVCELADITTEPWGYSGAEIYHFLQSRGYCWFSIMLKGKLHVCLRKAHYHENLIAVPEEKIDSVKDYLVGGIE
jgi:FkbM family methyltransferase